MKNKTQTRREKVDKIIGIHATNITTDGMPLPRYAIYDASFEEMTNDHEKLIQHEVDEALKEANLSKDELNLTRMWYESVKDIHPEYLDIEGFQDTKLYNKIREMLGWKAKLAEGEGAEK